MPYPCWGPALRCGFPPSSADQEANGTGYRSWPVPFLGYASGPAGSLWIGASSRPGALYGAYDQDHKQLQLQLQLQRQRQLQLQLLGNGAIGYPFGMPSSRRCA